MASAQGGDPEHRQITLELTADGSGNYGIDVQPDPAIIWRGKKQKMKKVEWVSVANPQHDQLYWELRWDTSKGGGSENYFGDVDLQCGADSVKAQPKPKPKIPRAEWPYSVAVYSCSGGAKGQLLKKIDPRIRWDD